MRGTQALLRQPDAALRRRLSHTLSFTVLALASAAVAALLATGSAGSPASLTLVAMAVSSLLATIRSPARRWLSQLILLVVIVAWSLTVSMSFVGLATMVGLILGAAWLGDLAAEYLGEAEAAEVAARDAFEHRAEILSAVRDLVSAETDAIAPRVTGTLHLLGYTAAAVVRLRRDGGSDLLAVAGDATVISRADGNRLARASLRRSTSLADLGESGVRVVASPVLVEREQYGALVGVRTAEPASIDRGDRHDVEVLASHYGAALSSHRRMRRQQELLERLVQLDRLRTELITAVTTEVRDPLTVVSGITQVLEGYGNELTDQERSRFLERFSEQSGHLQQTLETLLDVAQLQARGTNPSPRVVDAVDLLIPVLTRTGVVCVPSVSEVVAGRVVRVDPTMIRLGVELLTEPGASGIVDVAITEVADAVELRISHGDVDVIPDLSSALATQLLVSGGGDVRSSGTVLVRLPKAVTDERP